jgi:hypothetical protein
MRSSEARTSWLAAKASARQASSTGSPKLVHQASTGSASCACAAPSKRCATSGSGGAWSGPTRQAPQHASRSRQRIGGVRIAAAEHRQPDRAARYPDRSPRPPAESGPRAVRTPRGPPAGMALPRKSPERGPRATRRAGCHRGSRSCKCPRPGRPWKLQLDRSGGRKRFTPPRNQSQIVKCSPLLRLIVDGAAASRAQAWMKTSVSARSAGSTPEAM